MIITRSNLLFGAAVVFGVASISGLVATHPVPKEEYVFVEDPDRWVEVRRGSAQMFGKLDSKGNFVHAASFPVTWELSAVPVPRGVTLTFCGPGLMNVEVYEYRSGRLVLGVLDDTGNFVPKTGATAIEFKDYKCGPDIPPIWNLPGYFINKKDLQNRGSAIRYGHMLAKPT